MFVVDGCGALFCSPVRRIIRIDVPPEARKGTGVDENLTYIKAGKGGIPYDVFQGRHGSDELKLQPMFSSSFILWDGVSGLVFGPGFFVSPLPHVCRRRPNLSLLVHKCGAAASIVASLVL
ncbi:hypothetical protein [Methylococcus capsulatus]|uniref:hypothetical protein n=1 Tax=Methylococcus capsulatus TaxID=414 RepID=UPI0011804844|nr:hypothetical protein [Methylococcus capsulatus]